MGKALLYFQVILFCSVLGCVLPLRLSLSFAVLVHTVPNCPTMSSLQRRVGLPADLTPIICHSVFLMVHLLSFIRVMCPALFQISLLTFSTKSVSLVLCLMMVLRILSFRLTFSIIFSIACWLVSSFFSNAFVRGHIFHLFVIAG